MKKTNKKPRAQIARSKAHLRILHRVRIGLFSILLLSLVVVRSDGGILQAAPSPHNQDVLAYSTSMSRTDLLNATNAFRAQNGLGPLNLDSRLNTSSQNKAQHMVDNNYWAHDAPDGTTPWYFFNQAGYSYSKAGENLAYGFNTSQDAVNGWIASPGHRANMLGDYVDVGFGFVDGPNYQGGPNTVVVAHYGSTAAPAPTPAPTSVAPATTTPAAPTPTPPAATPAPTPVEPEPVVEPETPKTEEASTPEVPAVAPVAVASTHSVNILEQLSSGRAQTATIISTLLVLSTLAGFALTHRSLVHHAAIAGEHFVMKHPVVDSTVIVSILGLILTTTVGRVG